MQETKEEPIRVLLVDDSAVFLRSVTSFLEEHKEIAVVGSALGGQQGLARAQALRPDAVLVDLAMPDISGFELIPLLRKILPASAIVAVTLFDTSAYEEAAMEAGAHAFITKTNLSADLIPAIYNSVEAVRAGPSAADP